MKMSNIILFLFMLFVATTLAQPSETEEKAVAEKESESSARMMWYYGCQLWKFPAYAGAFQTGGLKGCTPLDTVYRTSCRGRCVTRAYINPWENANYLNGDHNCCKPTGFQKAVANFKCLPSNGRGSPTVIRKFTYTMITGCQCQPCCKGGPRQ